jgi:hypothetical protein
MKLERNLGGRKRQETTAKGDIAFLPADAPTMLRPGRDEPERVVSYSYLVFRPSYLADLALSNGIGGPLDFIPTFATPDPFLHEIAAALTCAPRIYDPAANLFIESVLNADTGYTNSIYEMNLPPGKGIIVTAKRLQMTKLTRFYPRSSGASGLNRNLLPPPSGEDGTSRQMNLTR